MFCPIALQLYSVRNELQKDFPGTLAQVKEMGYDGVELAGLCGYSPEQVKKMCEEAGLVPILEPEIDIFSTDKAESERIMKGYLQEHLAKLDDSIQIMFKLSIPDVDGFYSDIMEDTHVVRVVALSGGYSRDEADEKLARNPGLIASFSRALTQGLNVNQTEEEFNNLLRESIDAIYKASIT